MAKGKVKLKEFDGATEFGVKEFTPILSDREKFMTAMGFELLKRGYYPDGAMWHNAELRIAVKVDEEPASIVAQYNRAIIKKTTEEAKLSLRTALLGAMGLDTLTVYSESPSNEFDRHETVIVVQS